MTASVAIAIVGLTFAVSGCQSPLPTQKQWIEVRSEHFVITSRMNEGDTVALAHRLELFRAAVLGLTNIKNVEAPIPTYIYAFDTMGSFNSFRPAGAAGFVVPDLRGYYIALVATGGIAADRVLKHEYAHFLTLNGSSLVYPRWYREGFAEFISTIDVKDGYVVVGLTPRDRIRQFGHTSWISMERILAYDGSKGWTPDDASMFYLQSWALIHYLMRDTDRRQRFAEVIGIYLAQIEAGVPVAEASQAAFGMTPRELDRALQGYLTRGQFISFGVPESKLVWSRETTVRPLDTAIVAERLGELALHAGKLEIAGRLFEQALSLEPDLARAHAGVGDVIKARGEWEEARPHFERAVALDPDDPLNQLDAGEYWHARAQTTDDPKARHEMLRTARRHYVRAYDLDGSRPEPYAVYGATYLLDGEDAAKGIETLQHAASLLPSSMEVRMYLAEAYVDVGRDDEARPLLTRILAGAHEGAMIEQARTLMRQLDGDPADPEALGAD